jgi:hypothetical protein
VATTPHLLEWFDAFNRSKPHAQQVRPFNFLLMFQADRNALMEEWYIATEHKIDARLRKPIPELPRVVAPYHTDPAAAARSSFDRNTGKPVPLRLLKSYAQALAQYHLHPEAKFLNAEYLDSGVTGRRHVEVAAVAYVGKEAHRWEEQSFVGLDPEAQIDYGVTPQDRKRVIAKVRKSADTYGQRKLAAASSVSLQQVSAILLGAAIPTDETLGKLIHGMVELEHRALAHKESTESALRDLREMVMQSSMRAVAGEIGIDPGNLGRMLNKKRTLAIGLLKTYKKNASAREAH